MRIFLNDFLLNHFLRRRISEIGPVPVPSVLLVDCRKL